jgi:phosphoribosylformylglycinamidine synthase subunit PurQ / glutaminase
MARIRVLILRAAGTNCDLETQHAWELAGATCDRVHVVRLVEQPKLLDEYQVLTLPGGFSYGDDIAAGRILAARVIRHWLDDVRRFIDAGKLVLGVCNGFQVLVQAGLLPLREPPGRRTCTITYNDPPGFQDRWINLRAGGRACAFLEPGREYEMPIAHGEGRIAFADAPALRRIEQEELNVLRYVAPPAGAGVTPGAPDNPNGSAGDIAGLCDETGRVLGLMPHPERFVAATQHPSWTSRPPRTEGDGLAMFRQAVRYLS